MAIGHISQTVQRVAGLVCSTEIVHVITQYQCMGEEIVLHLEMPRIQGLVTLTLVQVTLYISNIITLNSKYEHICFLIELKHCVSVRIID